MSKAAHQQVLALWQQYKAAISRTLLGYEADYSLRQDLMQELYLALYHSAERLAAAENQRAYLFRVMHNVAVDHIARASRQRWQPLEEQELPEELTAACPSEQKSAEQQSSLLLQAVQQLSPAHRQVVLLAMEDTDPQQIADILGLSHGAVRVRLSRAKAELQELLDHASSL
ncbi:RNA polymerase sigma factor [Rheinheimera marina]|uniref:RNA polymerase sigma factor n=1 Tax=Rheinheimera marina TaxID=1774958 RepID=A0ABV9JQI9_9GAMM